MQLVTGIDAQRSACTIGDAAIDRWIAPEASPNGLPPRRRATGRTRPLPAWRRSLRVDRR